MRVENGSRKGGQLPANGFHLSFLWVEFADWSTARLWLGLLSLQQVVVHWYDVGWYDVWESLLSFANYRQVVLHVPLWLQTLLSAARSWYEEMDSETNRQNCRVYTPQSPVNYQLSLLAHWSLPEKGSTPCLVGVGELPCNHAGCMTTEND